MPEIFLPLDKAVKCHLCGGVGHLRLCSQCAECAYCSVECQKRDWNGHKLTCKTDRIDLTSYYPVLACIADATHVRVRDIHPALRHQVINSPTPDSPADKLPDGSTARIVKLGKPVNVETEGLSLWWPTGPTPKVQSKLFRRIGRQGRALPIVTATCLAIILAVYSTTTKGTEEPHRIRLRYRSSPISDFGIVSGSARVTPEDQLAYVMPDNTFVKGQDPKDHYWIYFRTQKGEEVLLDCNMFTFNMCLMVDMDPYSVPYRVPQFIPALFVDRTMTRSFAKTPQLLMERRRLSVLRDKSILKGLIEIDLESNGNFGIPDESIKSFTAFMSRVAGRTITDSEKELCMESLVIGVDMILDSLRTKKWKRFPAQPQTAMETDPGEVFD